MEYANPILSEDTGQTEITYIVPPVQSNQNQWTYSDFDKDLNDRTEGISIDLID